MLTAENLCRVANLPPPLSDADRGATHLGALRVCLDKFPGRIHKPAEFVWRDVDSAHFGSFVGKFTDDVCFIVKAGNPPIVHSHLWFSTVLEAHVAMKVANIPRCIVIFYTDAYTFVARECVFQHQLWDTYVRRLLHDPAYEPSNFNNPWFDYCVANQCLC